MGGDDGDDGDGAGGDGDDARDGAQALGPTRRGGRASGDPETAAGRRRGARTSSGNLDQPERLLRLRRCGRADAADDRGLPAAEGGAHRRGGGPRGGGGGGGRVRRPPRRGGVRGARGGARSGAFAEYVSAKLAVARKPANLSFEEAAAVPVGALTALEAIRDQGNLQTGQRVLVNGASGGVGTFAVQLAKALGAAHVTAVCSTRNVERVRTLGADHVVDYTREDYTLSGERCDLIIDVAGNRSWRENGRVLFPGGTLVLVGMPTGNHVTGPLPRLARVLV